MKLLKTFLYSILTTIFVGIGFASAPNYYIANYDIADDREKVSEIFVQIEANNKIGTTTPIETFEKLNNSFETIFPQFPQDYDFKVIYEQCLQLSNSLSNVHNYNTFVLFMNNCYKPFSQILNEINTDYTIKANATANPDSGSAPLNVTFDARSSLDPSNETIPSENYFWYYRDTNGEDQVIGEGPVVNHTFEEAGNYLVHLTVRSSNNNAKGIFDGSKTLSIDVTPKAAVISVYANSKKLKLFQKEKFSTQEGIKGLILDGSATIPIGGRQILNHKREISSNEGFSFEKQGVGEPGIIKVVLPKEGEYTIELTTTDNESNKISEEYFILISDPVAIIKQTPEQGNTNNIFSFDSSTSYSVMSSLRLFTREIFDKNGEKLDIFQGKSIKKQFKEPGSYTIKLTVEDELGQSNIDTSQVYVESSDPIAQYSVYKTNKRKYPSRFTLDASLSSDIDLENGYDELSYDWSFSNPNFTNIESTQEENKKITISFDSVGTHKIKLNVTDQFGKLNSIEKTIDIESTLRPEIFIAPQATTRGSRVNFVVKSNQDILSYKRDFGDGESVTTQSDRVSHIYNTIGTYQITLTVNGKNGMENIITDNVFIGDKNSPIGAYTIYNEQQQIIRQNEECIEVVDGETIINPAYKIERYKNFDINTSKSVNIKGTNDDLSFYFQPRNGEIYKESTFKYSFDELGCKFIDFTTEDTSVGVNHKQRIWFKVYNSLPTLNNLILYFPQYGNEMGVGFNENHVKDIFNSEFDPLIVKVQAQNPKDADGFISYFKRYYYYKDDPTRIIETKITPGDINYAYFSLPRIPGEFMFGVTMYDNDDGRSYSTDVIGNGPIVFFPPDTKRPDIPLVTLKANKTTVEVGDEIVFDVISKIISDKEDFIQERTIMYDFDGDGERDLTTKKDRVSHVYTEPNDIGYTPRASVLYRGYKGIGKGASIIVKKGLKPRLLFDNAGKFTIVRDISIGDIKEQSICLSYVDCKRGNEGYYLENIHEPYFYFEYPEYQKYFVSMNIADKYANESTKKRALSLQGIEINTGEIVNYTGDFKLLSIPQAQTNNEEDVEIMVGSSLDNSILFYVLYDDPDGTKECYVDLDISDENEKDFYCNQLFFSKFDPKYESNLGKIYYQKGSKTISKDLKISFLDFSIVLDEATKVIYDKVSQLIMNIQNETLKALLLNLQKGIIDPIETQSNIIALQTYITSVEDLGIQDQYKEDLQWIINELSDETTISANGATEYDIAKAEILAILPANLQTDTKKLFNEFENAQANVGSGFSENDERKLILNTIIQNISEKISSNPETQQEDQIAKDDMDLIIMPNFCKITQYYDIVSETCSSQDTKIVQDEEIPAETAKKPVLKIILMILGLVVGIFVILIIIFAVKAKLNNSDEE